MTHTTRSGAEVKILRWLEDRVLVRYVDTGAVRSVPREALA